MVRDRRMEQIAWIACRSRCYTCNVMGILSISRVLVGGPGCLVSSCSGQSRWAGACHDSWAPNTEYGHYLGPQPSHALSRYLISPLGLLETRALTLSFFFSPLSESLWSRYLHPTIRFDNTTCCKVIWTWCFPMLYFSLFFALIFFCEVPRSIVLAVSVHVFKSPV